MSASRLSRGERLNGWLFMLPAVVLIFVFLVFPILWSLWMSFQVGRGMNFAFGGFSNIVRLTQDPVFQRALGNTVLFFLIQVPIMLTLAALMAVALNDPTLRFRGLFRTAIFLPCVTSLVAYSALFKSMFADAGLVNNLLLSLHLITEPIYWIRDPFWAKVLIIAAITWRWTGYNMIFYLAAMQNIDRSIYEAARIDGVAGLSSSISPSQCSSRSSCSPQ
jgi:lactose/L-arabinose transport system permease protein